MLYLFTKYHNITMIPKYCHHHLQPLCKFILINNFCTSISTNISTTNLSNNISSNASNNISSNVSLIVHEKTTLEKDLLVSWGFKSSTKHVSVVKFFKSFGFSDTQIKTVITKNPSLLIADVSRIIQPKIEFFRSVEFSEQDVIKIVTSDPYVLMRSLQNHLIPAFNLLKKYYGGQDIVVDKIKLRPSLFRGQIVDCLAANVKTLRDIGVVEKRVVKMITGTCCLASVNTKPDYFRKVVSAVLDMGFDPNFTSFEYAVHAMAWHSERDWVKKMDVFKSLGFSEKEIYDIFKKQPMSLCLSEKKIRVAAKFYFEKFNWSPSHVAKYPNAFMYSLEKRVIPRCSVLQVLVTRDKVKNVKITSLLTLMENEFLEKYVDNYKDEIPEVLDAYEGTSKIDDFSFNLELPGDESL